MLLYKSDILFINYLEIQYLTHIKFQEDLKILTINELKGEFFNFFDKMVKRKGRHILFDAGRVEHLVDAEFIGWFNRMILSLIASQKADKVAWLFRPNAGLPQIDEKVSENILQKTFTVPAEAMKWLLDGAERKKFSFQDGNVPKHKH
ncbi:MAG: hypothetical protein JXL97_16815 [Bacteroidales bacterium]|nr:hypothetical protein [Bacteroidales bacterium]